MAFFAPFAKKLDLASALFLLRHGRRRATLFTKQKWRGEGRRAVWSDHIGDLLQAVAKEERVLYDQKLHYLRPLFALNHFPLFTSWIQDANLKDEND